MVARLQVKSVPLSLVRKRAVMMEAVLVADCLRYLSFIEGEKMDHE